MLGCARQISSCDAILATMEDMLGKFQGDLGNISSEIRARLGSQPEVACTYIGYHGRPISTCGGRDDVLHMRRGHQVTGSRVSSELRWEWVLEGVGIRGRARKPSLGGADAHGGVCTHSHCGTLAPQARCRSRASR